MEQKPMIMNIGNMVAATARSKRYVTDLLSRANDIENDTRKSERLDAGMCKACFTPLQ